MPGFPHNDTQRNTYESNMPVFPSMNIFLIILLAAYATAVLLLMYMH